MNIVKCISGLPGEGKTEELLEEFLRTNKLGKGINAVFITCEQSVNGLFKHLMKIQEDIKRLDKVTDVGINYMIVAVDTEGRLLDTIRSHVEEYDCSIYIDDPHSISKDFTTIVEKIVDSSPNSGCLNSVDITYTRIRDKQL